MLDLPEPDSNLEEPSEIILPDQRNNRMPTKQKINPDNNDTDEDFPEELEPYSTDDEQEDDSDECEENDERFEAEDLEKDI